MSRKTAEDFPLLAYADGLVEDLRELVPKAVRQWDAEAIHRARVATRRLRAVVDVLEPIISPDHRKPFGQILRKLRRRLGPLRDTDVMLGHLEHLTVAGASSAGASSAGGWLSQRLCANRDNLRQTATRKVVPPKVLARLGAWWGVREELAECHQAVDTLLAESLHLQLDAFMEQANSLVGNRPTAADAATPDPHELRIAGKALRYTLEMAVIEGHRLPAAVTRSFRQMQEALGLWHDYVVLAEQTMQLSLDELLPHHDAHMQAAVLDVARAAIQRSARQLARFSSLWSTRGEELAKTIRQSFPLTQPAAAAGKIIAPQMDRDPTDSPEIPPPPASSPGETSAA